MKGECVGCGLALPSESAAVDPVVMCSDCYGDQADDAFRWGLVAAIGELDGSEVLVVRRLIDHLTGTNRVPDFESIGIKSR